MDVHACNVEQVTKDIDRPPATANLGLVHPPHFVNLVAINHCLDEGPDIAAKTLLQENNILVFVMLFNLRLVVKLNHLWLSVAVLRHILNDVHA